MATTAEDIDPDGDVVLVVGEEEHIKRLRVSSAILTISSPVFKALLGPHFREGQQTRSTSNPVEIPLPDDDYEEVVVLCRLLHHQSPDDDLLNDVEGFVRYAQLVDKYDCSKALKWSSRGILLHWSSLYENWMDVNEGWSMVQAAFYLRESYSFRKLTQKMVSNTGDKLSVLRRRHDVDVPVLDNVLAAIDEKRTEARDKFVHEATSAAECLACQRFDYEGFLATVARALGFGAWPPAFVRKDAPLLKDAVNAVRYLDEYERQCCRSIVDNVDVLELTTKLCEGLCLDCVLENKPDLTEECSDAAHD